MSNDNDRDYDSEGSEQTPEEHDNDETINSEYNIWLENRDQMYGTIVQQQMKRPNLTFQWLPVCEQDTETGIIKQQVIMGTYTDEGAVDEEDDDSIDNGPSDVLQVAQVEYMSSGEKKEEDEKPVGARMTTLKLMKHDGDVNKARAMPGKPNIIATISGEGKVYLFNSDKYTDNLESSVPPELTLDFHTDNGFGLSWHPRQAQLLTAADDGSVALWDTKSTQPVSTWSWKSSGVNAVQWHHFDTDLFGYVTEDARLAICDSRTSKPSQLFEPHEAPVNSLSFNQKDQHLLATASHDHTVALFDLRYLKQRLNTMSGHTKPVDAVEWSPHAPHVLASSARDRRVILWDIRHIGEELQPDETEDALPELLFMHGGHRAFVNDMGWNPQQEWVLGSLDNECVQVWRPIDTIVGNSRINPDEDELEFM